MQYTYSDMWDIYIYILAHELIETHISAWYIAVSEYRNVGSKWEIANLCGSVWKYRTSKFDSFDHHRPCEMDAIFRQPKRWITSHVMQSHWNWGVWLHTCRKRVMFGVLAHMVSRLPLLKFGCFTSTMVSGFPLVTVKTPRSIFRWVRFWPFSMMKHRKPPRFRRPAVTSRKKRRRAYEKTSAGPQCGASLGRALAVRVHRSTVGDIGRWQERGGTHGKILQKSC